MKTYQQCSASHPRKPVSGNYKPESPKFSEKSLWGWLKLQSGEFRTLPTLHHAAGCSPSSYNVRLS